MKWKTETTTMLDIPEMTRRRRKRIAGPSLPDTGAERIEELHKFMTDLGELYDCDHHDVYDSVFFTRVGDIMVDTVFDDDDTASIRDMGQQILDTRATSTKLYIAFFKSILGYLHTL